MIKVKLFEQNILKEKIADFEKRVNDFIKDKEIINIEYSTNRITYGSNLSGYTSGIINSILIMYKEV